MKHFLQLKDLLLGVLATAAWGSQPSTQWAVSAGYPGTPYKVVTDAQRNVYVTGTTYSADTNTSTSTADMLTAKYDVNGSKLWEIRYNGPYNGFDAGYTIAVDEGGNVFVAGASSNGSSTNAIFAKYNPDGQELWFQRYTENQNFPSSCGTLSLDDAGNVYLALAAMLVAVPAAIANGLVMYAPLGAGSHVDRVTAISLAGFALLYPAVGDNFYFAQSQMLVLLILALMMRLLERGRDTAQFVVYILLLGAALYHGLYGLRGIVLELPLARGWQRVVNAGALLDFFTFGYVAGDRASVTAIAQGDDGAGRSEVDPEPHGGGLPQHHQRA